MQLIQALLDSGSLTGGQANSLTVTLTKAIDKLNSGKTVPAINVLNAFTNKVNAHVSAGTLTADEGQELIVLAEQALAAVG